MSEKMKVKYRKLPSPERGREIDELLEADNILNGFLNLGIKGSEKVITLSLLNPTKKLLELLVKNDISKVKKERDFMTAAYAFYQNVATSIEQVRHQLKSPRYKQIEMDLFNEAFAYRGRVEAVSLQETQKKDNVIKGFLLDIFTLAVASDIMDDLALSQTYERTLLSCQEYLTKTFGKKPFHANDTLLTWTQ
ncbi:MAG: hypothetical protein HWN65_20510 [Candidatus Helarchaeota archaeon]|nr:hypothetical protein [Candidatus Helarchaeota archaeon]